MKKSSFLAYLSFLSGASWAYMTIGAIAIYTLFSSFGFYIALFFAISFVFTGMLVIVFLEALRIQRSKLDEMEKQTALLERLEKKLGDSLPDN